MAANGKQANSEAINIDEYIFTATADQAVFVPANPINPTFAQVFVNGILFSSTTTRLPLAR